MTFSRPSKAPPQMNRMLVVSICTKSWFGCLRPPCGGTEAMVPSISFSSACCTPSPETSRVIDGLSRLARDLVDLVDVDDAALRLLDVVVAVLQQLLDDVLDVLADIAGLGQRGGVGDHEGHVQQARQRLREQRLARAGRADQQDVALGRARPRPSCCQVLAAACSGCRRPPTGCAWPFPGRSRTGPGSRRSPSASADRTRTCAGRLVAAGLVADDVVAQVDALVADEHRRARRSASSPRAGSCRRRSSTAVFRWRSFLGHVA